MIKIFLPKDADKTLTLKAGDKVLLSGTVYTARDCAHKRLYSCILQNEKLPIDLKNACIYYAGPCPAPNGKASGSCGPTTSARVDVYTPLLLDNGLKFMIGKGERDEKVISSIAKNKAVYFCAIGGAGALYGNAIEKSTLIAYEDLLSEAIYKLEIENFPLVVGIDSNGNTIF